MAKYYKLLKSGESRCRSLRRVQLGCLNRNFNEKSKDFSHPYYWDSFVVSSKRIPLE